jgi:hypothetical protein
MSILRFREDVPMFTDKVDRKRQITVLVNIVGCGGAIYRFYDLLLEIDHSPSMVRSRSSEFAVKLHVMTVGRTQNLFGKDPDIAVTPFSAHQQQAQCHDHHPGYEP